MTACSMGDGSMGGCHSVGCMCFPSYSHVLLEQTTFFPLCQRSFRLLDRCSSRSNTIVRLPSSGYGPIPVWIGATYLQYQSDQPASNHYTRTSSGKNECQYN